MKKMVKKPISTYDAFDEVLSSVLSAAILETVDTSESYRVLPEGTWMAGGCGILAMAIKNLIPGAELVATKGGEGVTQHILVRIEPYYYDASGRKTLRALLRYWKTVEGVRDARITRLGNTWPAGIPRSATASNYISELIRTRYVRAIGLREKAGTSV